MTEALSFDPHSMAARINAQLADLHPHIPVFVVAETESTNADLLRLDYQADAPSCVLLTLHQSQGRGRQGRTWLSDAGSLTFSIRWQFHRSPAALNGLPLAVGVATLRGLESYGIKDLSIKWPNDLLKASSKLGGILLEIGKPFSSGQTHAVIGIGINLLVPSEAARLQQPAAALLEEGSLESIAPVREDALIALLQSLLPALVRFDEEGFEGFRQEWMQHAAWLGQPVMLSNGSQGTLMGVDQDGALLLDTDLCIERFLSGDVSLRPVASDTIPLK